MAELSIKEQEIIKLKSQGLKNREIAKIVYPQATQHAGDVLISRALKKPDVAKYVDQGVERALSKHNIHWDNLIGKLKIMLDADKTNPMTGEISADYAVQLNAIKTLISLMPKQQANNAPSNITELTEAINNNVDDVELQRITFKKSAPQ